jgi:hypothetical protein
MSKTDNAKNKIENVFLATCDIVREAIAEYVMKNEQMIAEMETRAQALFTRIAPEYVIYMECSCIHAGDENILCQIHDLVDGFGTLSLSFHKGVNPDADFFTVENYMELSNPTPIYTLYDLGKVLGEITDLAEEVLRTVHDAAKSGFQDGNPGNIG